MTLSKRQIERIGLAHLENTLYRAGISIAIPLIDEGIDLIAYVHNGWPCCGHIKAVPIQLKAFSGEEFYTDTKYLGIPGLVIVYLWHTSINGKPVRLFGMPYADAENIVTKNGWSRKNGIYARTAQKASKALARAMGPYELFKPADWPTLLFP